MKKYYVVLLCLLSFSLFSCASKRGLEDQVESEISTEIETPLEIEVEQTEDTTETIPAVSEEITTEATVEIESEENLDQPIETQPTIPEPLEEIEEPEVITLEPADEIVYQEEDEVEIVEEPIEVEPIESIQDVEVVEIIEQQDTPSIENSVSESLENTETIEINTEAPVVATEDSPIEIAEETKEPEIIIPSRSIEIKKLEYLDITYPGSGWIYMGLTDGSKDLTYFGRKVGTENTKFSVQAKNSGTKLLHFYKNDSLTNTFIDDYLEVIVLDEKGSNKTHIAAPDFKMPVQKKKPEPVTPSDPEIDTVVTDTPSATTTPIAVPVKAPAAVAAPVEAPAPVATPVPTTTTTTKTSAASTTVIESQSADDDEVQIVEQIDTELLLKEIKSLVKSKSYKQANDKLAIFFEHSTKHRDEALYLQGQILEANSEIQNITAAIDSYTTLTKNYPASKYWDDANKRVIYLKRFYLEGR